MTDSSAPVADREATPAITERPPEPPPEPGLVFGRPVEDRSFEAVEATVGFAAGVAIGTAIAGPVGAAVGGLAGLAGGFVAGEALERAVGRAARTTDATEPDASNPG